MYKTHSRAGSGRLYPRTCTDHCCHSQREFRIQPILRLKDTNRRNQARDAQIKTAIEAGMDDVSPCSLIVVLTHTDQELQVVSKPFRIPDLIPKIEELKQKYQPDGTP